MIDPAAIAPVLQYAMSSLDGSFDALRHTRENGQGQSQHSNPKRIPLFTLASIVPPLG
jgi:hypothetical protein